jgi:Caspase domain
MFHFSKHWIIVLMLCMTAILANAQKLHMFIITDDTDSQIGSGYDFGRMQLLAQDVATKSSLSLVPYYYKKSQTTSEQLVSKLNNLTCSSDDVVWFYYTGHGFNPNDGSAFTAFVMPDRINRFKMDVIEGKIQSKNPRLSIIMYDACNYTSGSNNGSIANRISIDEARCRQLFRKNSGIIKVASNTAGEGKYSYGNNTNGGIFTSAFIAALNETDGEWQNLLSSTKSQTQAKAKDFNREQIPYYILNLKQNSSIAPPPNSNNISGTPDEPGGADF